VGAKELIDVHFSNDELEWYTEGAEHCSHIITGLLVRIDSYPCLNIEVKKMAAIEPVPPKPIYIVCDTPSPELKRRSRSRSRSVTSRHVTSSDVQLAAKMKGAALDSDQGLP